MRLFRETMLASGLFIAASGIFLSVVYADDLIVPQSICNTILDPATCDDTGDLACLTTFPTANSPCGGDCISCVSTISLPTKICIWREGSQCVAAGWDERAPTCGESVPSMHGECDIDFTRLCWCENKIQDGNCLDVDYFLCK